MSDGKISTSITSRQVVHATPEKDNRLRGTITNRVVEEKAPEPSPPPIAPLPISPSVPVVEVDVKAMVSEAVTERLKAIEETYKKKLKQLEEDYDARLKAIEKSLKTKLDEHVSAMEKNKPVVNVTVENRTKVIRTVKRDDRGLITEIHEVTETI